MEANGFPCITGVTRGSVEDSQGDGQGCKGQLTMRIETDEIHVKNHGNKDFFLQRFTISLDP